jgi:hypothetical protein
MQRAIVAGLALLGLALAIRAEEKPRQRVYDNRLTPIPNPKPLLADHPQ